MKNKISLDLEYIYPTKVVLQKLNRAIIKKQSFSNIRFGDAVYGILFAFLADDKKIISAGKWSGNKGKKLANTILGQLTIPTHQRLPLCQTMVNAANRADFIDSYDAYKFIRGRRLGIIARNWKEIHENIGITNDIYCSCFIHYFSIVDGEYNLFDIMKGRKIFCVASSQVFVERLKKLSGAELIHNYVIPRRGRKNGHYRLHYKKVMKLLRQNATKYDLFLIGAGFLGKIYCDQVKKFGGRSFDAGRLFDFWSNIRRIDSTPKRFISYNSHKMLCDRIKTPANGEGLW